MSSNQKKITTVTLDIAGMHCASCAMNIDFALEDLKGVSEVTTHYAQQKTQITFESDKVNPKEMIAAIAKLGYQASLHIPHGT